MNRAFVVCAECKEEIGKCSETNGEMVMAMFYAHRALKHPDKYVSHFVEFRKLKRIGEGA